MNEIDYRALYEQEKHHREEAERKYEDLVSRVKPLLTTLDTMAEPMKRVEKVLQELARLQKPDSIGDGHEV